MALANSRGASAPGDATGRTGFLTPAVVLAVALLIPYLQLLWTHWFSQSAHAMASLLALMAAVAVGWLERPANANMVRPSAVGLGLVLLALCTLAYALSLTILTRRTLVGLSATGIVACLWYLRSGRQGLKTLRYPFALALLAVPFPGRILEIVSYHLVELASFLGATVLSWLLPGITQQGSVIQIAGHGAVEVISDCNGLAGVLMFLPIAVTVIYFRPQLGNLAKAVILVLAVPLALFGNLLRIVATGVLQVYYADLNRSEIFHQLVGFLTLGLALLILLGLPRIARSARNADARAMP